MISVAKALLIHDLLIEKFGGSVGVRDSNLLESDGNKRTGYVIMRLFLIQNQLDIQASQEEKYNFVLKVTEGKLKFSDIVEWIREKIK